MPDHPRILIIDDDLDIANALTLLLETKGYEVMHAGTGAEGLSRVRLDNPDLVLLDLMIEKHDTGFTVARTIKSDPTTRHIPVIMLTSVIEKTGFIFSQERDGHWMKTDRFLEKPVKPEILLATVQELLKQAGEQNGSNSQGSTHS